MKSFFGYISHKISDWVWYDEDLLDEIEKTLVESIIIPKPRFKVGDKVVWQSFPTVLTITEPFYSLVSKRYTYLTFEGYRYYPEAELELATDEL